MKKVYFIIGFEFGQPIYHIMWIPFVGKRK